MPANPNVPVICVAMSNERSEHGFLRGLTVELSSLLRGLEPAVRAGKVELKLMPAATLAEIADAFQDPWLEGRIRVFHYAGHADEDELFLETEQGGNQGLSSMSLARFLSVQQGLHLVFLNGCATQEHADLLIEAGIPAVVVTATKINDQQAVLFAKRFYRGMASGANIEESFTEAEALLLGNTQNVQEDISRGLFWRKRKEQEKVQFPWRFFVNNAENADNKAAYWRLFGGFIDTGEEMSMAEAIAHSFIGKVFNNYKIVKLLGIGSFGLVFKAVHENFHNEVAIKITHRILEGFEDVKRIITNGNRALHKLKHPNLVQVIDAAPIGQDYMYVIMELVKGERMDKMDFGVSEFDETGWDRMIGYAIQLCEGILLAHNLSFTTDDGAVQDGVVHGNIKAKKVRFTPSGIPKLIDFLFADFSKAQEITFLVPDGPEEEEKSKPDENPLDFLPPEVASGQAGVTKKTDIYGLGAMFFSIISGQPLSTIDLLTEEKVHTIFQQVNPGVPRKLSKAIFKAIDPDPSQRYAWVESFLVDLRAALSKKQESLSVMEIAYAEEHEDPKAVIDSVIGKTLSGYRIAEFLGEGRQGFVFIGVNEKDETERVAIKLSHRIRSGFDQAERILRRNAQALIHLNHPNVVQVKGWGTLGDKEYIYIIRELVDGERLDKINFDIPRLSRFKLTQLAHAALWICEGLHAAHTMEYIDREGETSYGMMHGNLKTRKIILADSQYPKIIDFMFGEIMNDPSIVIAGNDWKTRSGERTLDYMPPEVVAGNQSPDKRTDIYALGAIFFEILIGHRLSEYHPDSDEKLYRMLRQRNRHIPRRISKTLFRAIHPDPYRRYHTVKEFMKDILKNTSILNRLMYRIGKYSL